MPSIVHTTTANSLSVTIPATTPGNTLVVCIMSAGSSAAATVSGITLGGVGTGFAQDVAAHNTTFGFLDAFQWSCPNIAGSQTAVVISGSNLGVGSSAGGVTVYETTPTSGTDKTSNGTGNTSIFSSGSTAATTQASEIWIGCALTFSGSSPTGPGSPWTNVSPGGQCVSGDQVVSSTGTAVYSGNINTSAPWAAVVATYKAGTAVTPAPFTPPRMFRGFPAARPGRPAGRALAPAAVTPAPFRPPRMQRGPGAAVPGRPASSGRGTVVTVAPVTPAPLVPFRGLRGRPAAVPGRILRPARGTVTPVIPVTSGIPVIAGDILKPWRKHAWPRGGLYPPVLWPYPLAVSRLMPEEPPPGSEADSTATPPPAGPAPPGQAAAVPRAIAAAAKRAARRLETGRVLQDPAVADGVFYWQQRRKGNNRGSDKK